MEVLRVMSLFSINCYNINSVDDFSIAKSIILTSRIAKQQNSLNPVHSDHSLREGTLTLSKDLEDKRETLRIFSQVVFAREHLRSTRSNLERIPGYLCNDYLMKDIHSFLANDKIRDRDILLLFSRFGDSGVGRMTYLSYLSMLKPYFDHELARDLLLRDTVAHRKERDTINN